jgi:hypothetical protein
MTDPEPNEVIRHHLRDFFPGHDCSEHVWTLGPAHVELPRLRVAEFAPGPTTDLWIYSTIGAWEARDDPRLEFLITPPEADRRHVELLFMAAWYHRHHGLGTGHTFPIGEPWLTGSLCDHFLVSLPYTFDPQLQVCNFPGWHAHVVWILPITAAEREFKVREGVDALEQKFEDCELEFWVPGRASEV